MILEELDMSPLHLLAVKTSDDNANMRNKTGPERISGL